jgi:RNA polymerase sigma factor (sigma-70 family)
MSNKERIVEVFKSEYVRLESFVRSILDQNYEGVEPGDIIQDVALNLFSRPDVDGLIENYTSYIYRSVRNRIYNLRSRRKPVDPISSFQDEKDEESIILKKIPENSEGVTYWESEEMQSKLMEAIGSLAPHERMIIIETEYRNRSFESVSREWDIPVGTLLARKHRALSKLRKILEIDKQKFNT